MTLEEAKTLADQGNINAMVALGDYYSKQDDKDATDIAYQYYERAAEGGDWNSTVKMAQTTDHVAAVTFAMIEDGNHFTSMDADIEKAFYWAHKLDILAHSLNINPDVLEFVEENLLTAVSRLGTLYYFDEKYEDLVRITKDIKHPYAQALYGLALFQLSDSDSELAESFRALRNVENEVCWKKELQGKFSRMLPVEAGLYLSGMYRVQEKDIDSAYRVLDMIASRTIDDSVRQDVREKMASHFRKKLFGGYTYIE